MIIHVSVWQFARWLATTSGSVRPKIYYAWIAGGKKNRAHHKYKKNSDDDLPSSWMQYHQTVRHRYVLFVFMSCSLFFPPAVRA